MENNPAPNINKILVKRQYIDFICEGEQCAATFDLPHGGQMPDAALIIVSGGHDIRSGYNGAASILAAQIAAQGIAVMRYDRRGIGDSEGVNRGWRQSEADLQAAIIALRDALPHVKRIFAYGNCDAASLLCLHGQHCNINGIIASNPWGYDHDGAHYYIGQSRNENSPASIQNAPFSANGEEETTPMSGAILRRYYWQKFKDISAWRKQLSAWGKGKHGLADLARSGKNAIARTEQSATAAHIAKTLSDLEKPCHFLLSSDDVTGAYFYQQWQSKAWKRIRAKPNITMELRKTGQHGFIEMTDRRYLADYLARIIK